MGSGNSSVPSTLGDTNFVAVVDLVELREVAGDFTEVIDQTGEAWFVAMACGGGSPNDAECVTRRPIGDRSNG